MSCPAFVPRLAGELLQPFDVAAARHHAAASLECKSLAHGHRHAVGGESSLHRARAARPRSQLLGQGKALAVCTLHQPRTATTPPCPAALRAPSATGPEHRCPTRCSGRAVDRVFPCAVHAQPASRPARPHATKPRRCHLEGSKHISKGKNKGQASSQPPDQAAKVGVEGFSVPEADTSAVATADPETLVLELYGVSHTVRRLRGFLLCELCNGKAPSMRNSAPSVGEEAQE